MHIGILQTGTSPDALRPETGDYPDMFVRLLAPFGHTFTTWNLLEMAFPPGAEAAEGWLITGSRHAAYEDLPWIAPLEDLIRAIVATGRPLVGICFGHQIIAQALGGRVEKASTGWRVGRTEYTFDDGETLALNAWHQDQVIEAPKGALVIATAEGCPIAGMTIGAHVWTVQPHPEFDAAMVAGLLEHRGASVPAPLRAAAAAGLGADTDQARAAERIAAFFNAGSKGARHVA